MMPADEFICIRQQQKQPGGTVEFHWRDQRQNENEGYFGRTKACLSALFQRVRLLHAVLLPDFLRHLHLR
jgi:hypothetical protein